MFSPEERKRAVEPYFMTSMMTAEVVERLGYPTRQRLEHWPVADSHYAGRMRRPVIPLRTRRKAIELVLGGMQQRQAARQPGASVDAVNDRVKACREGGMATLRPRNGNAAQNGRPAFAPFVRSGDSDGDDVEALRRGVAELELGEYIDAGDGEGSRKRPRHRSEMPEHSGEDAAGRSSAHPGGPRRSPPPRADTDNESGTTQTKPENGCVTVSKKTSAAH